MRSRYKRFLAVMLIAAMTTIPAFTAFAAPWDEYPFGNEFPFGYEQPFGSLPEGGGFGLASPSNLPSEFIPGGNMWGWNDPEGLNPADYAPAFDLGTEPPFDPEAGFGPEFGFGTGSGSFIVPEIDDTIFETKEEYADETYDAASETVTDDESEADEEYVVSEGDSEYYAKLLVYDLDKKTTSDELLSGYIDKLFYGEQEDPMSVDYWRTRLSDYELEFYDALKDFVQSIAAGDEDYPIFDAQAFAPTARLGRAALGLSDDASNDDWYEAALKYYQKNRINVNHVMSYIYRDDPDDFYWTTRSYAVLFSAYIDGDVCVISPSFIYFPVDDDYAGDYIGSAGKYALYDVWNQEIKRARYAAENAREIIRDHRGESNSELLSSLMDEISELRANSDEAARPENDEYYDAWQLVYVFDKDPTTAADSEAYDKALQYLCEASGIGTVY